LALKGCFFLVMGVAAVPLVIALAGEDAPSSGSIAAAIAIFAVACIGLELRSWLPLRRDLPRPPADANVGDVQLNRRWYLAVVSTAACVAIFIGATELLAELTGFSRTLVPGFLLGTATAHLVGAFVVRLWQTRHHRKVLVDQERAGKPRLFAAD
jgi:hypothetical protein